MIINVLASTLYMYNFILLKLYNWLLVSKKIWNVFSIIVISYRTCLNIFFYGQVTYISDFFFMPDILQMLSVIFFMFDLLQIFPWPGYQWFFYAWLTTDFMWSSFCSFFMPDWLQILYGQVIVVFFYGWPLCFRWRRCSTCVVSPV